MQGTVGGHAAVITTVGVVLQIGLKRQRSVFGKVDAQRGGEGKALFLVVVELRVGRIRQAHQAIGDAFVFIHRSCEVQAHAALALGADRGLDLVISLVQRFFAGERSEEHTSELQSLMRISYAVLCLQQKKIKRQRRYVSLIYDKTKKTSD